MKAMWKFGEWSSFSEITEIKPIFKKIMPRGDAQLFNTKTGYLLFKYSDTRNIEGIDVAVYNYMEFEEDL